ncbi:MAG: ATP-binding protein, partial [Bacteroidota bacterium]
LALELLQAELGKPVAYLDLELDSDLALLGDEESYLRRHFDKLLIIDEVQLKPNLFKVLRGLIDLRKRSGESSAQYLLLGSASPKLLQQSAESLAGRIRYLELTPFMVSEVSKRDPLEFSPEKLWFRGGFPLSYLAPDDAESWSWRSDFISTYLERDIPQLGIQISASRMRRFWTMIAHLHGQQVNFSSLAKSLEVSHTTIRNYLDVLTDLYMIRQLPAWSGNTKKRLVKSPKVFLRDSGILHRLLSLATYEDVLSHPVLGFSWEGFVIENILSSITDQWQASYYRSSNQHEIDLVLEKGHRTRWAIEIKRTIAPKVSKGFHVACEDIKSTQKWVIHSGKVQFPLAKDTEAIGLMEFLELLREKSNE